MRTQSSLVVIGVVALATAFLSAFVTDEATAQGGTAEDQELSQLLATRSFTPALKGETEKRLGRKLMAARVELGKALFFDPILAVNDENTCAACHAPQFGFGDSQPIAIGVENNGIVGPGRTGPRNQRHTPMVLNVGFLPKLMWNGRFSAPSGDPFDNRQGFEFPAPETTVKFAPVDETVKHLLAAQGHIPPTELPEMAGFVGRESTAQIFSRFGGSELRVLNRSINRTPIRLDNETSVFQNNQRLNLLRAPLAPLSALVPGPGSKVPVPDKDSSGSPNEPIRALVLKKLQDNAEYRRMFAAAFPEESANQPINFRLVGAALAEFQLSLEFLDAGIDRFATGDKAALSATEKRGGILFMGSAGCWQCHMQKDGKAEMFSDFKMRNIAVFPLAPSADPKRHNVDFVGSNADEDFGLEDITKDPKDRYKFRTSPLRNIGLQASFMHNGAFKTLEGAIRHHLDPVASLQRYSYAAEQIPVDLRERSGPTQPLLQRVDPLLRPPTTLTEAQVKDLVAFVGKGLQGREATVANLCSLRPKEPLPSGAKLHKFEGC